MYYKHTYITNARTLKIHEHMFQKVNKTWNWINIFFVYEITPNTNIETRGDKLLWNNVGGMLCIPCNTALWNKLCDTLCKTALTMLYNGRYDWLHYNGSQYAGIRCKTVILQSKHRAARRSLIRGCSDFLIVHRVVANYCCWYLVIYVD